MALINSLGRYVKLDKDGAFEVYVNEEARLKLKASTPAETICRKYEEVIAQLHSVEYAEMRYYSPKEYNDLLSAWEDEYGRYDYRLITGTFDEDETYPLMAEYYPDVADSVPKIIARGTIGPSLETVEQTYIQAKQDKSWGETTDA